VYKRQSLANTTMQGQQGLLGGALNGAGAVLGLAHGGSVPCSFVHRMSGGGQMCIRDSFY